MRKFQIVSDSSCDIPAKMAQELDINIVPYYSTFNDKDYKKEGVELSTEEFYHVLRTQKVYPKTSLPSISDYMDVFRGVMSKEKTDILCICLTSKFSGSYQSSVNAKEIFEEEFPGYKLIVVDSMLCTFAQGFYVIAAAKQRDAGATVLEAVSAIDPIRFNTKIVFTVDSLSYLIRGGRIGKVAGFAGELLNIKPILTFHDGELHPKSRIRGRKKAVGELLDHVLKEIGDKKQDYTLAVLHSDVYDEAMDMINTLKNDYGLNVAYDPMNLGTTIGTHIGPTVLGIVYQKNI